MKRSWIGGDAHYPPRAPRTEEPFVPPPLPRERWTLSDMARMAAEIAILRGTDCGKLVNRTGEPEESNPCGVCVKCLRARAEKAEKELAALQTLRPADDYHEDMGDVLWWHLPVCEAPICGTSLDEDFDPAWHTHWSPLPLPPEARPDTDKRVSR